MSYLLYHIQPSLLHQDLTKYASSLSQFLNTVVMTPYRESMREMQRLGALIELEERGAGNHHVDSSSSVSSSKTPHETTKEATSKSSDQATDKPQPDQEMVDSPKESQQINKSPHGGTSSTGNITKDSSKNNQQSSQDTNNNISQYYKDLLSQKQNLIKKLHIILHILYDALKYTQHYDLHYIEKFFQFSREDVLRFLEYCDEIQNDSILLRRWILRYGDIDEVLKNPKGLEKELGFRLLSYNRISEARELFQQIHDDNWLHNCDWLEGKELTPFNERNQMLLCADRHEWKRVLDILARDELEPIQDVESLIKSRESGVHAKDSATSSNSEQDHTSTGTITSATKGAPFTQDSNAISKSTQQDVNETCAQLRYNIWLDYVQHKSQFDRNALMMMASNLVWSCLNQRRIWIREHIDQLIQENDERKHSTSESLKQAFESNIKRDMIISEALALHCVVKIFTVASQMTQYADSSSAGAILTHHFVHDMKSSVRFIGHSLENPLVWALIVHQQEKQPGNSPHLFSNSEVQEMRRQFINDSNRVWTHRAHIERILRDSSMFPTEALQEAADHLNLLGQAREAHNREQVESSTMIDEKDGVSHPRPSTDTRPSKKRKMGVVSRIRKRIHANHVLLSSEPGKIAASDSAQTPAVSINNLSKHQAQFLDVFTREMLFRGQYTEAAQLHSVRSSKLGNSDQNGAQTNLAVENILLRLHQKFVSVTQNAAAERRKKESTPTKKDEQKEDKMEVDLDPQQDNKESSASTPDVSAEVQDLQSLYSATVPTETILAELLKQFITLDAWDSIKTLYTHFQSLLRQQIRGRQDTSMRESSDLCSFALRLVSVVHLMDSYISGSKSDHHNLVEELRFFCNSLFTTHKQTSSATNHDVHSNNSSSQLSVYWPHVHILTSCVNVNFKKRMISVFCYYLYSLRSVKNQPKNQFQRLAKLFLTRDELYMVAVMQLFQQQDARTSGHDLAAVDANLCDIVKKLLESLKKHLVPSHSAIEHSNGDPISGAGSAIDGTHASQLHYELQNAMNHNSTNDPLDKYIYLWTLADVNFERQSYRDALKMYMLAASRSSNHFSTQIPEELLSAEVVKRIIHCLRTLRRFTESAVVCQFLSKGYDQSFISDLKSFNIKWAQYFWDESFLELLLFIAHWNHDEERENVLLKLLERGDMNIHNPKDRREIFIQKLVKSFFRQLYGEIMNAE